MILNTAAGRPYDDTRPRGDGTFESPVDQTAFDRIADRIRGLANVLSSTNDSHEHTVSRLFSDPAAEVTGSLRAVPPQMPGQIGAVHAALDYLQHEVERASGFVSDFSRL